MAYPKTLFSRISSASFLVGHVCFFERNFGWKRSDLDSVREVKLSHEEYAIQKFKTEFLLYFEWWEDRKGFIEKAVKYYQLPEDVVKQFIPSEGVNESV